MSGKSSNCERSRCQPTSATAVALEDLRKRIEAQYELLVLVTWEEHRWLPRLKQLAEQLGLRLTVWSCTEGFVPPVASAKAVLDPLAALEHVGRAESNQVFVLKDFHVHWADARVVRRLRDLLGQLRQQNKTVLLLGPAADLPLELRKDAVRVELPPPDWQELREELQAALRERQAAGRRPLAVRPRDEERLLRAVLGLTARQARQALTRALLDRDRLDDEVLSTLVAEKKVLVEGSQLLDFCDWREGVNDVGGLQGLKDWLLTRVDAFSERARQRGIPAPKGVLLLGVQGCGKSLMARVAARVLSFPLVRLDVASLLSPDVGASEQNLRQVLRLLELVAPVVVWMDEIEKEFAGAEAGSGHDAVLTRLLGSFLTWMQEHTQPIFVVATANSVTGLPPEMLRRGRFDELFFLDLPNYHERQDIFRIHLQKRGVDPSRHRLSELAEKTEGYSGAEIEQVVVSALIESFAEDRPLTDADLLRAVEDTVPLSVTMEEQIFQLREWARARCRPATPDSRVLQMLEAEQRRQSEERRQAAVQPASAQDLPETLRAEEPWSELAELGDWDGAVVELVRTRGRVSVSELQRAFSRHGEVNGPFGLSLRSDPNVVVAVGLSDQLASVLSRLVNAERVWLAPGDQHEVRGARSSGVSLPILDRLPQKKPNRPVWVPTVLVGRPPEDAPDELRRVVRMKLSR